MKEEEEDAIQKPRLRFIKRNLTLARKDFFAARVTLAFASCDPSQKRQERADGKRGQTDVHASVLGVSTNAWCL